jgi:hypothetical protein
LPELVDPELQRLACAEEANSVYLSRPLRLTDEWRGNDTGQRGQQEAAAIHAGIVVRAANQVKCICATGEAAA